MVIREMDLVRFTREAPGWHAFSRIECTIDPGAEGIVIERLGRDCYSVQITDPDTNIPLIFAEVDGNHIACVVED